MTRNVVDVEAETRVPILSEGDIVTARQSGRALAAEAGLSSTDRTLVATAISEVARNIVQYAQRGEIILTIVGHGALTGIQVTARDYGPGISDTELAMRDGYSTANSLGMGLPGARRLMDEFTLTSVPGEGTVVTMKKWRR
jgi:serine/threonine-protein kinase RsbT